MRQYGFVPDHRSSLFVMPACLLRLLSIGGVARVGVWRLDEFICQHS
jgi:hypothetical protein